MNGEEAFAFTQAASLLAGAANRSDWPRMLGSVPGLVRVMGEIGELDPERVARISMIALQRGFAMLALSCENGGPDVLDREHKKMIVQLYTIVTDCCEIASGMKSGPDSRRN